MKGNRVRNWGDYNKALIGRGSITCWLSPEIEHQWRYQGPCKRGGLQRFFFGRLKQLGVLDYAGGLVVHVAYQ